MSPQDREPGDWLNPQPAATADDPGMSYDLEAHSDLELGKLLARYERGQAESGIDFESEMQRITEYLQPRWDERVDRIEDVLDDVLTESSEVVLDNRGGRGNFLVDPTVWSKAGDHDGQYLVYASVWVPDTQVPMTPEYIDNRAELSADEYAAHFNNIDVFLGAYDARDGRVLDRSELDHDNFHRGMGYDVPDEPGLESEMSPIDALLGGIGSAGLKLGGRALLQSAVSGAISMGGRDVGEAMLKSIVAKLAQVPAEAFVVDPPGNYETDPALLAEATVKGSTSGEPAGPDDELMSLLDPETEPLAEEGLMSPLAEDELISPLPEDHADATSPTSMTDQFDMEADAAATAFDPEEDAAAGTFDMAADIAANVAASYDDADGEVCYPDDDSDGMMDAP
jgi:hypothetical protein